MPTTTKEKIYLQTNNGELRSDGQHHIGVVDRRIFALAHLGFESD